MNLTKYKPLLIILFCLISFSYAKGKNERFYRILNMYENPSYVVTDRDVISEFDYYSRSYEKEADTLGLTEEGDDESSFSRDFSNKTGLDYERYRGKPHISNGFTLETGINGTYKKRSELRENKLINKSDTYEYLYKYGGVYCDINWDFEVYKKRKRNEKKFLFLGWDISSNNYFRYTQEHWYRDYNLTTNDAHSEYWDVIEGVINSAISPKAGFGKPVPYTALFKAFQIERILKQSGVIKGDLSDSTIIKLAHWMETEFIHGVEHDRPEKFFYAALDSVLKQDTVYDTTAMNPYACMHVKEMADLRYRYLEKGTQISFLLNVYGEVYYKRREREVNGIQEEPWGSGGFDYDTPTPALGIRVKSGIPISPRLFFSFSALKKSHLGKNMDFSYYNAPKEYFTFDKKIVNLLTEIIWDASFHFWIHDRVIFTAEMEDLYATVLLPRNIPKFLGVSMEYFVADHMSLLLSFKKFYECDYREYFSKTHTERISLGLRYDF